MDVSPPKTFKAGHAVFANPDRVVANEGGSAYSAETKGDPVSDAREMDELLSGIAKDKAELDAMRPLSPSQLAVIRSSYDLELTYTSNAIEGNTLTLRETKEVIEHGVTIAGKALKDHLEAVDHHEALDYLYELAGQSAPITDWTVREIHTLVLKRSQSDIAGKYSPMPRKVLGSATVFPDPLQVPGLMEEFGKSLSIMHPSPRNAFDAHFRLTNIHPFSDGNGRTARLLMNLMLVRGGYRPVAVRPGDRAEYLDALETASNQNDIEPFQLLLHRRLAETMSDYARILRETHANQETLERRDAPTPAEIAFFRSQKDNGRG